MKANELRIGNVIQLINGSNRMVLGVSMDNVTGLTDISTYPEDKSQIDTKPSKYYQPIPITEEWLVKLGFTKQDEITFVLDDELIQIYKGEFYYSLSITAKDSRFIGFVHQLQNIYFVMTGEELTIIQ